MCLLTSALRLHSHSVCGRHSEAPSALREGEQSPCMHVSPKQDAAGCRVWRRGFLEGADGKAGSVQGRMVSCVDPA